MKRLTGVLVLTVLLLSACGGGKSQDVELTIFAAASLTETLTELKTTYEADHPEVTITYNFDSSGTLLTQIREGAGCDLFLSAAQKQMDALEEEGALLEGSRVDLLENQVVLCVPGDNPKAIADFDGLAQALTSGDILMAMGNSDVPVGQYTQKILAWYGMEEEALAAAGRITYGSNVKEVVTQISEGSVDCGVVYRTDASSAGLRVMDCAAAEMCGQVICPAAVLGASEHSQAAQAFLDFLQSTAAMEVFEKAGFTPAG